MIAAFVVLAAAAAVAPEPSYVVERVVRSGDEMRRTSVFRNGMAVVVWEKGGRRTRFNRQALNDVELRVLAQITEEAYPDLQRFVGPLEGAGLGTVELRLAPMGRDPLLVRLPVGSVASLGAARIGQALDALETELARAHGPRGDLRAWEPQVGERVELDDGRVVRILEILGSETGRVFRLQIDDGPASIFMNETELRRVAVRRVGR